MQWQDLISAFALYLILEGIVPFLSPRSFKRTMLNLTRLDDGKLRGIGIASMLAGILLLLLVR